MKHPHPRPIAILGAPSAIGIRLYDDGGVRRLDLSPGAFRAQGLATRLAARDQGDVLPPPYREMVRPPGRVRNESEVLSYTRALADRVAAVVADGTFLLLLGGDCSILLGALLGVRRARGAPVGLAYFDAHADFATPQESRTGSAASMDLALAVGRGDTPLARLTGEGPLVEPAHVALLGRRDQAEPWYGHDALLASEILDLPLRRLRELGSQATTNAVLPRLTHQRLGGFWIHLDADVLDPALVPAVDSPIPDGFELDEIAELLVPLASRPEALGMQLTIYDPSLDSDGTSATRLVELLERVLGSTRAA